MKVREVLETVERDTFEGNKYITNLIKQHFAEKPPTFVTWEELVKLFNTYTVGVYQFENNEWMDIYVITDVPANLTSEQYTKLLDLYDASDYSKLTFIRVHLLDSIETLKQTAIVYKGLYPIFKVKIEQFITLCSVRSGHDFE